MRAVLAVAYPRRKLASTGDIWLEKLGMFVTAARRREGVEQKRKQKRKRRKNS
jgi:hypothetical protein